MHRWFVGILENTILSQCQTILTVQFLTYISVISLLLINALCTLELISLCLFEEIRTYQLCSTNPFAKLYPCKLRWMMAPIR